MDSHLCFIAREYFNEFNIDPIRIRSFRNHYGSLLKRTNIIERGNKDNCMRVANADVVTRAPTLTGSGPGRTQGCLPWAADC